MGKWRRPKIQPDMIVNMISHDIIYKGDLTNLMVIRNNGMDIKNVDALWKPEKICDDKLGEESNNRTQSVSLFERGYFTTITYKPNEPLLSYLNNMELLSLLYLATFAFKNDNNRIHFTSLSYGTRESIRNRLRMPFKDGDAFIDKCIEHELLLVDDDDIMRVSPSLFLQNKILANRDNDPDDWSDNFDYKLSMEFFHVPLRKIYHFCPIKDCERFACIYRLIPYLNPYHNVICKDVFETEFRFIKPIGVLEIANICGCSPTNSSRFFDGLESLTFDNCPGMRTNNKKIYNQEKAIDYTSVEAFHRRAMFVNPNLICKYLDLCEEMYAGDFVVPEELLETSYYKRRI